MILPFRAPFAPVLALLLGLLTTSSSRAQLLPDLDPTDPPGLLSQFQHDVWQIDDGLPQNSVKALLESASGYLWFGTEEGLVRFSGQEFVVFDRSNTRALEASQDIRALLEDAAGSLLIGTGAGVIRLRDGLFEAITTEDGGQLGAVSAIGQTDDGTIWIGTLDRGLWQCQDSACEANPIEPGRELDLVRALLVDRQGALWVGTDAGLWRRLPDSSFELVGDSGSLFVMSLLETSTDGIWVGTREGLFSIKADSLERKSEEEGWPDDIVWSMLEDGAGEIWLGLGRSGLVRYLDGRLDEFDLEDGLSHVRVLSLLEDSEESLWVGTEGGGLNRIRPATFLTFSSKEGLSADGVLTVCVDPTRRVWVGTEGGGLNRIDVGEIRHITTMDGLASDVVTSVFCEKDGSLWVGTLGGGLQQFRNGVFHTFTVDDGLPSDAIFALHRGHSGLWIGTDRGLVLLTRAGFSVFTSEVGLPSDFVTAIHEDSDGDVWIGTYDAGLIRLRDGSFEKVGSVSEMGSDVVLGIHEDSGGRIWVGSYGGGLSLVADGAITNIRSRDGLFDDTIYQILEDDSDNLWMGSNRGIFRVQKAELLAFAANQVTQLTSFVYDTDDGLRSREVNGGVQPAGWKDNDGRLWFPTVKGVAVVDPSNLHRGAGPPKMVIEGVTINHDQIDLLTEANLDAGVERIEFKFTALTFVAASKVRYRYRLAGFDADWSDLTSLGVATYTNLDPGQYHFEVVARDADGIWSEEPAEFSFYVKPYFYQSPFFWMLSLFSLGLAVFLGFRVRIRHLTRRQDELETAVEERTKDLQDAKEQIESQAARLRSSLQEKEVLLKEVHHRVKNNLQVISSLLGLQSAKAHDESTIALFRECRSRIQSMAMVHEHLYQSEDLAQIDFATYLEKIAHELGRSHRADRRNVDIRVDVEPVSLSIDQAIPAGLIVNELVSNALKHAFTNGSRGEVRVSFTSSEGGHRLVISDNGVGLPSGFESKRTPTLGLKLVEQLVRRLQGQFEIRNGVGVTFELVFPAAD